MHHLYRVHHLHHHPAPEDLHDDADLSHTYDEVDAMSLRGAAERWVKERFSDLDYPSCVEGLVVTGPGGQTQVFDVEVRSEPVFIASKARGEAR